MASAGRPTAFSCMEVAEAENDTNLEHKGGGGSGSPGDIQVHCYWKVGPSRVVKNSVRGLRNSFSLGGGGACRKTENSGVFVLLCFVFYKFHTYSLFLETINLNF